MVTDLPADPDAPLRTWASLGTPCTGVFLPVAVLGPPGGAEAVVPPVLSQAGAWDLSRQLSRAVEVPGDAGAEALATVRAAIARFEAEVWAEADLLWEEGAPVERWHTMARHWSAELTETLPELVGLVEP